MTATAELVARLRELDVQVWAEGDRLCLNAPQGVLTDALRDELTWRKGEILDLLRDPGLAAAAGGALPTLRPAPAERHEPFPLTDIQQAYWVGRRADFDLGNVAPHFYLELDVRDLDLERLETALDRVIERHEMLRCVVTEDGLQRILPAVPSYAITRLDLAGLSPAEADERLAAERRELSHQVLATDRWPLFDIRAALLGGGVTRLLLSLDLLIGDAWSFQIFFRDLFRLYGDPDAELPPLELSFRDYVLALRAVEGGERHRRAETYWERRLAELPGPPQLPLTRRPQSIERPRFVRRLGGLPAPAWRELRARARREGLTPSGLLLTAFADVLAAWCREPRFTLNLTLFNRLPLHPQVNQIMGDFSATVLLVVDVRAGAFRARARELQRQLWNDLEHSYVSGVRVLRRLGRTADAGRARQPVVFTSTLGQEEPAPLPAGVAGAASGSAANGPRSAPGAPRLESVYSISQTPQVWIDHRASEEAGALVFNWDAVEELFPDGLLDEMFGAYRRLIERLAADEAAWEEPVPRPADPARWRPEGGTGLLWPDDLPAPESADEAAAGTPAAAADPRLVSRIRELVAAALERDELAADANLLDLGANSVDLIRIANRLERELGFRPRMEAFFRDPTVRGLAALHAREQEGPAAAPEPAAARPAAAARWRPAELLVDPAAREELKRRRLDLRAPASRPAVALPSPGEPATGVGTVRRFDAEPIPLDRLGRWLGVLRETAPSGPGRRLYPSAGGLYPVQVYLHVKAGRVAGLNAGTWYYHPVENRLLELAAAAEIAPAVHTPLINRPVYERAAFSVFLIAQAGAIAPLYGERGRDHCLIEAGAMLQALRAAAPAHGLGICPIGGLDFAAVRGRFDLDDGHELMHSLIGGGLPAGGVGEGADGEEEGDAALLAGASEAAGAAGPGAATAGRAEPPLVPISRDGELPLSSPQLRLWFLDQLEPGNPAYNVFGTVRVSGDLSVPALEAAISEIVRRHEVLRATFAEVGGRPRQAIAPPRRRALPRVDLRALPAAARDAETARLAGAEAARPFDLARGPLLRAALVDLGGGEHLVLFTMHHIVSDAWSRGIVVSEMAPLYRALVAGRPSPLPELPIQYVDFAAWQHARLAGGLLEEQLDYWRRTLAGAPDRIELPLRGPRPEETRARGARVLFRLPGELRDRLVALARGRDATLFMVLLAAYQVLLHVHSGQEDLLVGTPITNRRRAETEGLIGFFINTLAIRGDLSRDPTFGELLARVREAVLGAFAHQDVPFEQVVDAVRPERTLSRTPLFQVWFVLQNVPMPAVELPGLTLRAVDVHSGTVRHDLKLDMIETVDSFRGFLEYRSDLFEESAVRGFAADLEQLLGLLSTDPDRRLSELAVELRTAAASRRRDAEERLREARRRRLVPRKAGGA
jgi:SagB-type dehydrogenase family enzyme